VRNKIERLITIAKAIVDAVAAQGAATWHVAIENFAFHQHGAIADLGEINGVVKMQLWMAFGIEPELLAASTARKLVVGKGNIKKQAIIPALQERGFVFGDHNIADAYVMAEALRRRTFHVGGEEKPRARRARTRSTTGGRRGQPCRDPQTSLGIA
jgi:Holliday junction resolvasome RuvABC endonuclease subunit